MSEPIWCRDDAPHGEHTRRNEFGGTDYCSGRPVAERIPEDVKALVEDARGLIAAVEPDPGDLEVTVRELADALEALEALVARFSFTTLDPEKVAAFLVKRKLGFLASQANDAVRAEAAQPPLLALVEALPSLVRDNNPKENQ